MAFRNIASGLGLLFIGCFCGTATSAFAVEPTVSCLPTTSKLDDAAIKTFMDDPQAFMAKNPGGGLQLSDAIRDLAGSSSSTLESIVALTKSSNDAQKSAIAAGLAQVVYACNDVGTEATNNYGAQIQNAVAQTGDVALADAFQASSNDVKAAAVNAAAGTSSQGGGSTTDDGIDGSANGFKSKGDGPIDTTSGVYDIGSVNPYGDASTATSNSGQGG